MKKISELTDAELSYAIAKEHGLEIAKHLSAPGMVVIDPCGEVFEPCVSWHWCGPLLEEMNDKITVINYDFPDLHTSRDWAMSKSVYQLLGRTDMKRAICEAYLAWRLGSDEVSE